MGRRQSQHHPFGSRWRVALVIQCLVCTWIGCALFLIPHSFASASSTAGSSSSNTLPRSQSIPRSNHNHNRRNSNNDDGYESSYRSRHYNNRRPPWNPSAHIDDDGYLKGLYIRAPGEWERDVRLRTSVTLDDPCRIRQVPGDGNCLFHSISLCLLEAANRTQWDLSTASSSSSANRNEAKEEETSSKTSRPTLDDLYHHSQKLRADAVACLSNERQRLVLQGREWLRSTELVQAAAQQYQMTASEYVECMRQDSVWGGGPEIVALCNLLQRPIHVYELLAMNDNGKNAKNSNDHSDSDFDSSNSNTNIAARVNAHAMGCGRHGFVLRRMACFGSPRFDRRQALHILSADSRFPDVTPGQQNAAGNHFLAVFPVQEEDDEHGGGRGRRRWGRKRLRGGDSPNGTGNDDMSNKAVVDDEPPSDAAESSSSSWYNRAKSKCTKWWWGSFVL